MNSTLLRRWLPFLAIAALQLTLIAVSDDGDGGTTAVAAVGGPLQGTGGVAGGSLTAGAGIPVDGAPSTAGVGTAGATGDPDRSTDVASAAGTVANASAAGPSSPSSASAGTEQPVDALGRPIDGDRSRCAEGGLLQEDITLQSPPCMPALQGGNGGATARGVTADTIEIVIYYPEYDAGVQQVLAANELAMTPQEAEELHELLEQFFNSHYEFYGRRIEITTHMSGAADAIELRAEAKVVAQKYAPFAVLFYGQGLMPSALSDQFARDGIVNVGVNPVADDFFIERAPYVWSGAIQGYRLADMAADYYCKRMYGKNASLAGDPTMQVRKRKLGVGSSEDPDQLKAAKRFFAQVTGGMCGSANDGTTLYTYSADPDAAEKQLPALVGRVKGDGITTTFGLPLCAEADRQGYFPENFIAEPFDDDMVGRVFSALCSPTQMENSFGIGLYPRQRSKEDKEFYLTLKSVNPSYDAPYLAEAAFNSMAFFSRLVQYAGPILTPQNLHIGAQNSYQIMGWENPDPWPGWTCCNPYAPEYYVGITQDSFTAKVDSRQIYWSASERSEADGATGAYVGVDESRRYEVGRFTPGEPKQP